MAPITLSKPIELRAKETGEVLVSITELTFREPEFGDLAAFDQGSGKVDGLIHLAARLAGIEVANMRKLCLADSMRVIDVIQGFLPAGLLTGAIAQPSSQAPSGSPQASSGGAPQS
ncbi:Phage tail assembly chaperone protein, E, or 41 or 14 [Tistlia consotensis]|uniref:Phage tail assembly chaperone protein, E, or 41 or 14 n=1 Tax=Tistlia consotensis USBA 355 TaxID=560819 RepID=A0A1Y6CZP6_9PROT|nr:phage tail assembly protein [Tistlia consotensis]SMF85923.1 Phage tail assembly chaperone protein, E, or 41 or 14 [Tistlia consotensis USBA 355]SNS41331.1 Phage tail assembly chaperone protein, E, or 41 or 14 [Tistlia consotensis]